MIQEHLAQVDGTPVRWTSRSARRPTGSTPACAGLMITNDTGAQAKDALGVHFGPYAEHGGGAAMARIVWGVADPFQKVEYGERFARDLGTTVRRIEGGEHFTPEDHPDVVVAAIDSLVAEVQSRA